MPPPPDADALRDAFRRSGARFTRVRMVVTEQRNPLLRLATLLALLAVAIALLLVILPLAILFAIMLFAWGVVAGALASLRARLEGRGAVRTREGRKNVRVIQR